MKTRDMGKFNTLKTPPHRRILQYGDCQGERWVGEVEEGIGGTNGDGRRLDLGW